VLGTGKMLSDFKLLRKISIDSSQHSVGCGRETAKRLTTTGTKLHEGH